MYLAPLNYDRFFKKVFSDPEISGKFLEDFHDTEIESIEILKEKHAVTVRKFIGSGKLSTDEIAEITGLSTQEVQSMQEP